MGPFVSVLQPIELLHKMGNWQQKALRSSNCNKGSVFPPYIFPLPFSYSDIILILLRQNMKYNQHFIKPIYFKLLPAMKSRKWCFVDETRGHAELSPTRFLSQIKFWEVFGLQWWGNFHWKLAHVVCSVHYFSPPVSFFPDTSSSISYSYPYS